MAKRIGISDVAKAAGVSATTVSHALSGQGKMSPQTRIRVERVAEQLGYAPNRIASALRRQRTGIVGFVSDEVATTPFAGQMVLGAQDAAAANRLLLMMVSSNGDPLVEREQINALLAHQVDAVVYATMYHRGVAVPPALFDVPTVLVNGFDSAHYFPSVVPDEQAIGEAATDALIVMGHRSIALVTIDDDTPAKVGRLRGHRIALARAGLSDNPRLTVSVGVERNAAATGIARVAFASFLEAGNRPTSVVCFNDQIAMGVYQAAALFDLVIPRDLSVVGVDNLEIIAANLTPGLTTVALPHYDMGRWAVAEAANMIESAHDRGDFTMPRRGSGSSVAIATRMQCYLVQRDSIAPPAAWRASNASRRSPGRSTVADPAGYDDAGR